MKAIDAELPTGIIVRSYGRDPNSSISLGGGSNLAGQRSFWVENGDEVMVLDIEDSVWWKVCLSLSAAAAAAAERPKVGWVPAPYVRLLTRRESKESGMFPGHDDWHGVTDDAVAGAGAGAGARRRREKGDEKEVEDDSNDNNNNGYNNDEDREVSKLMTYKRLLDYWASSKGVEMKKMPAEWLVCVLGVLFLSTFEISFSLVSVLN